MRRRFLQVKADRAERARKKREERGPEPFKGGVGGVLGLGFKGSRALAFFRGLRRLLFLESGFRA